MSQTPASKSVLNGIMVLIGLLMLAGGGYLTRGLFTDIAQTAALSNSQEILNYYDSAQKRYRSERGAYGTMRQLLDSNMLYLGAGGDIKWADEMERHSYRFHFSVSENRESFSGEAIPLDRAAKKLREFTVKSPSDPGGS